MARSDLLAQVRDFFFNATERRLRAPWRTILWFLVTGIVTVVLSIPLGFLPEPAQSAGLALALYAVAEMMWGFGAVLVAGVGVGYLLDRRTLADFGLGVDGQWWRDAAFGLALGGVLPTIVLVSQLAAGFTTVTGLLPTSPSTTFQFGPTSAPVRLVLLGAFFLVQATAEEVIVRGYLLTNVAEGLAGLLGKWWAVVAATAATGALFGLGHALNPSASLLSTGNIVLYGFLLGACYVLTGRLGVAVGFHVAWNYSLALLDFPVSGLETGVALIGTRTTGPELVTGGAFGPEGGLIALPILVVGSAALAWWVRREYGRVEILDDIATPELRSGVRDDEESVAD